MYIFSKHETISILIIFIFIHKTEHLIYRSKDLKTFDRRRYIFLQYIPLRWYVTPVDIYVDKVHYIQNTFTG